MKKVQPNRFGHLRSFFDRLSWRPCRASSLIAGARSAPPRLKASAQLIAAHPEMSRWRLSFKLCEAWNWVQPNGQPRAMLARSLMLASAPGGPYSTAGPAVLPAQQRRPAPGAGGGSRSCRWRPGRWNVRWRRWALWRSGRCAARPRKRSSGGCSKATITCATPSRWASTSSTWFMPGAGRSPAWLGPRHRATWGRGTGSSAGRRSNGGPTCTWWPTTPDS